MKALDIQNMYLGLGNIITKKVPIRMSFIINRNRKKLEDVVRDIDENRQKLLEKYGERQPGGKLNIDENGGVKIVDPEAFSNELMEILNADIDITLDRIALEDIEKCDTDGYDKLTVEEVGALEQMIIEDATNEQ